MSFNKETGMYEGYIYKIINDINDKVYIGQTITTIAERWHGHMSSALNEKRCKSALYNAMRKYGRDKFHVEEISKYTEDSKDALINTLNLEEQKYILQYKSLVTQNGYNLEKGGNNKRVPGRKVHKYDLELNYICSYESCREAARQNNIDDCTIYACCKHDYFTAAGYVWCFDGEQPIKPHYKTPEEYNRKPRKKKPINKLSKKRKLLTEQEKHQNKLSRIGYYGKIIQYNSFKKIINEFDDIIYASEKLNTTPKIILDNCYGKSLQFNQTVLRFEGDDFNKFPRSKSLQAITVYDLQGNVIENFINIIEAEKFVGCYRGEILKTIKRGGSYHGYMFSFYDEPLTRKTYCWNKHIDMCDDEWNIIKTFNSLRDVNRYINDNLWSKTIQQKIELKEKYKGYYWKYKEEFAITA